MDKRLVEEQVDELYTGIEAKDFISNLEKLIDLHKDTYSKFMIRKTWSNWAEEEVIQLVGIREENEREEKNRLAQAKATKENRKRQYEELKKEFEGENA